MYKTINGWTKEKMIAQIKLKNNGSKAEYKHLCRYRTDEGNACFVGAFIPDDVYSPSFEGSVHFLLKEYPNMLPIMPLDEDALAKLQHVHDGHESAIMAPLHQRMEEWINDNVEDA